MNRAYPCALRVTRVAAGRVAEVLLEPGRADDLQQPSRLVAGVPEGVRRSARLGHELARARLAHLVAHLEADAALEHAAVFVLAFVGVQRRGEDAWVDRMLDERERAARRPALDEVAHAKPVELDVVGHAATLRRVRELGECR